MGPVHFSLCANEPSAGDHWSATSPYFQSAQGDAHSAAWKRSKKWNFQRKTRKRKVRSNFLRELPVLPWVPDLAAPIRSPAPLALVPALSKLIATRRLSNGSRSDLQLRRDRAAPGRTSRGSLHVSMENPSNEAVDFYEDWKILKALGSRVNLFCEIYIVCSKAHNLIRDPLKTGPKHSRQNRSSIARIKSKNDTTHSETQLNATQNDTNNWELGLP